MGKKPQRKRGPKPPIQKSRKEMRKEQRKEKKLKRTIRHQWNNPQALSETNISKSITDHKMKATGSSVKQQTQKSTEDVRNKEKLKQKKLESEMQKSRKKLLLAANDEEDRTIRHLEKLLRLNRRKAKSLPKSFADDGLGYLLEVCDPETIKDSAKVDQALQDSGSEFEEDFAVVRGTKSEKKEMKSKANNKRTKKQDEVCQDAETDASDDSGSDFGLGVDSGSDEEMSDDETMQDITVKDKGKLKNKMKSKADTKKSNEQGKIKEDFEMDDSDDSENDFTPYGSDDDISDHNSDEDMLVDEGHVSDKDVLGPHKKKDQKDLKRKPSVQKKNKVTGVISKNTKSVSSDDSGSDFGLGVDDGSEEEMSDFPSDENISDEDMSGTEGTSDDEDVSQKSDEHGVKKGKDKKSVSTLEEKRKSVKNKKVRFEKSPSTTESRKNALPKSKKNIQGTAQKYFDGSEDDAEGEEEDRENGSEFGSDSADDGECGKNESKRNPDGTWEDIYGRTRDKDGNVIDAKAGTGKYIPPALRAKMQGNEDAKRKENLARLRRQIKGLINRLAENNLPSICTQMDELFMKNSRHDMNETLLGTFIDALVSRVLTPERLVMEHMLLIAVLHANVGTEVGATFLQNMMKKFQEMLDQSPDVENKELDNVILILSHLYNFKVFSASLMYEVLDKIAETLDEKRIELLLLVLRSVGFSLRKDDPLALKSLILKIQGKAVNCPSNPSSSSRVKFMLDILMAIKNNNVSKIPSYNPEHVEHLKKFLRSLVRRGNYVAELKITIDDLLKADERGRWWIVGSAWTGHLPGENPASNQSLQPLDALKATKPAESSYSTQLLDLARKQRMNTGVRKDIFCILMTAEDYLDAFEKLLHLNLKNQQRQEIVHVLFDCCLQEKSFNQYYAHLSQKFCDFDRQYQMKFQYCLWDKLKELDKLHNTQLSNLAKLLAHLFLEKGLAISALKVMSFAEMDKPCIRLVRQILLIILLSEDSSKCEAVFRRIAPSQQLHLFREGLRLFISHFVLRKSKIGSLPKHDLELLGDRAKIADRALSSADSRMEF